MPIPLALPQVTRIPITGPAPYNTLVCVQAETNAGPQNVDVGKLSRWSLTVPTPFKLAGFDQRITPTFDHSTTAFISAMGPASDDTWLYAVDSVTGAGFSPNDWTFFTNIDVAMMPGSGTSNTCITFGDPTQGGYTICYYYVTIQVTSFVLCYEPPLPPSPPPAGQRIQLTSPIPSILKLAQGSSAAERIIHELGLPAASTQGASPATTGRTCRCK